VSCRATTKAGRPCSRRAMRGSDVCHAHRGVQVGRPSKLTDEVERRLCDALRAGNHLETAAHYAGISRATLHRWLAAGAEDDADPRLKRFAEAVRKAIADGEWRAAIAYLERRHAQRWRRRDQPASATERSGPSAADIDTTDPETRALLSELLRRGQTAR
jgi:transposase